MRGYRLVIIQVLAAHLGMAQDVKLSIGVQLNPIINFNSSTASDPSGRMKPVNVGTQTGVEVNYRVSDRITISPIFKYYRKSQRIVQNNFFGYVNAESYTYKKYTYENIDPGILLKYRLHKRKSNHWYAVAGISYSFANHNELNDGYHLVGDNPQTVHLGEMTFGYTPGDLGTKINMWHPLVGIRGVSKVKRIGIFEYGLLFYIPTKPMPAYRYDQSMVTDDKGTIYSSVSYKSIQYSVETSVIYYLYNFNKRLKVIHPKRG